MEYDTIFIGTDAAAKTITIGNVTGATAVKKHEHMGMEKKLRGPVKNQMHHSHHMAEHAHKAKMAKHSK